MTTDLHMLTGAYALDALDADEQVAFEAHVSGCESCAEEVRGLRATGALLGLAAAVTPDEEFGRRLMTQVRSTRQQAPLPGARGAVVPMMLRRARTTSRALLAVAASLLVVAGGLGAVAVQQDHRADQLASSASEIASVLAAPDAKTVVGQGEKGGSARVIVSRSKRSAVFVGQDMPDVGSDHLLQLWVLGDGAPRPVGVVNAASAVVAHDVQPGMRLGVTVETTPNPAKPTTAPIMQLRLT